MTIRNPTYLMRAIVDARRPTMVIVLVAAAAIAMVAQAGPSETRATARPDRPTAGLERATAVLPIGDGSAKQATAPLTAALTFPPAIKLLPLNADMAPTKSRGAKRQKRRRRDRIENNCSRTDPLCGLGPNRLP